MSGPGNPPPRIPCPHCGAAIKVPPLAAGSRVNCPRCGQAFILGGAAEVKTAASAAPASAPASPSPVQPPVPRPATSSPPATSNGPLVGASQQSAAVPPAPQPAKPKPERPAEFGLTCRLCGTRMYATEKQIGQTIPCPDCHTPNEVKPPAEKVAPKKGPSLEELEEFALSEVVERPRYQPMVRPTGEDAILAQLNQPPATDEVIDLGKLYPDAPATPRSAASPGVRPQPTNRPNDDLDDVDELRLSAPVERPPPPPVAIPKQPPANSPHYGGLVDDHWESSDEDDGFFDLAALGTGPDRWKKAPFYVGIVEFVFRQAVLMRWIGHALMATLILTMVSTAIDLADQGLMAIGSIGLSAMTAAVGLVWVAALGSTCLTIVQDTANGIDEVEGWAGLDIWEWAGQATYLVVASIITALPGVLIGSYIFGMGGPAIATPVAIAVTILALLPVVLCSMMTEGSVTGVISPTVLRMIRVAGEGWMLFYMETALIGFFSLLGIGLWQFRNVVAFGLSGALLVMLIFIYMRLIGRLLWYSQKKLDEHDERLARREARAGNMGTPAE